MIGKKQKIGIVTLIIFLILTGGWFLYSRVAAVNYLIPGVPYDGFYSLFFKKDANLPMISSAMDILGYWGDERFDVADLSARLHSYAPDDESGENDGVDANSSDTDVPKFFRESGYEVYQWVSGEPGKELDEIKKFVNPKKKIPVIVSQRVSLDGGTFLDKPRVVIGVFDDKQKVVVHDYFFGNNYEISYQDFEKLFVGNGRAILAVWPSDEIKGIIKGPDHNRAYPARLEAMDKLGPLLASKLSDAVFYRLVARDYEKAAAAYKDFVDSPNFEYLPAAFRVTILSVFAHTYVFSNRFDEAIKVVEERVLPINQNLGNAPSGWFVLPVDKFAYPYIVLTLAFLGKEQNDLAAANYKEVKLINDINREKIGEDNMPFPPPAGFSENLENLLK